MLLLLITTSTMPFIEFTIKHMRCKSDWTCDDNKNTVTSYGFRTKQYPSQNPDLDIFKIDIFKKKNLKKAKKRKDGLQVFSIVISL